MKQRYTKKVLAFLLAFAMILTGSGLSAVIGGATADAASKKVTLKLSKSKLSMGAGSSKTLKITKKNVKKIKSQKWTSSKKSVATVSKKGKVTAKKAGKTTIKCTVKYIAKGSKKVKSKTLKCTVTVTAKAAATKAPDTQQTVAPTAQPTATPATPASSATPTAAPLKIKFNDKSNVGEAKELTIVGSVGEKVISKDNGTMRKELTSQYLVDNEMGLGINLGNTLEATKSMAQKMSDAKKGYAGVSATEYETAWSNAITTQEYIDTLHSYGINTLRIPVAWTNMDSEDGTYTINEKFMGRVEEVVNYALNNGMYVVLNDHWDNGWWGQFGASKYVTKYQKKVALVDGKQQTVYKLDADGNQILDENGAPIAELELDDDGNPIPVLDKNGNVAQEKAPDMERRAEAWKRYESYWTQIADRFKGYSDHLILESANEELCGRLNDSIYSNGYSVTSDSSDVSISGSLKTVKQYEITNAINQKFVDIVRNSGGNNANRHLLIAGFGTDIGGTADARFKMPTDTEENGKTKLFVSVHYYAPWSFCGDGGTGNYTDEDREATIESFKKLKKFSDEGYAIIIGEGGCCNPRGVSIADRSVIDCFRDTIEAGLPYHAILCLWETGQYFDRAAAKIQFRDVAQFFNEMTDSQGEVIGGLTGAESNVSAIQDVTGKTPVWSWTGKWYKNGGDSVVGDDRYEENGGTKVIIGENDTEEQIRSQFVPESNVKTTIDGDATEIRFDMTGYQAFLKLDLSKYKRPAIKFTFADGIPDPDENIGYAQLGTTSEPKFSETVSVDHSKLYDNAVELTDSIKPSTSKPWLSISFHSKPTVTGIEIYELGE